MNNDGTKVISRCCYPAQWDDKRSLGVRRSGCNGFYCSEVARERGDAEMDVNQMLSSARTLPWINEWRRARGCFFRSHVLDSVSQPRVT